MRSAFGMLEANQEVNSKENSAFGTSVQHGQHVVIAFLNQWLIFFICMIFQ